MQKLTKSIIITLLFLPIIAACTPGANSSPYSPSALPAATSTYSMSSQNPSDITDGEDTTMPKDFLPPADLLLSFIGLTLFQAEEKAKAEGYILRVTSIDGKPLPVTMDYLTNRLNVEIIKNQITRVTTG